MKKFYILSLCALIGASATMAESRFKTRKGATRKAIIKTEASAPIWCPESQTEYLYMDGDWLELGTTTFQYDSRGNAIQQDIEDEFGFTRKVTEFNEFNKPVSILSTCDEGDGWENSSKRTYVYDPVVHDLYIERLGYDWVDGEWVKNYYCETNDVTRNDDGNITEIVKSLLMYDEMLPAYKATWGYDEATGQANEFNYYYYNAYSADPSWVLNGNLSFRNIEWAETDGQMTATSVYEFLQGTNRIKYCDVYYADELDGHFIVEYTDTPGEYLVKETYVDPTVIGATSRLEILDSYGSFRQTDSEYFDEDGLPTEEPTYEMVYEVTFDHVGNLVLETIYETFDGFTEMLDGAKVDYIYDDNDRIVESVVSVYDYDTEEFLPEYKTEYGNYIDATSGVDNVAAKAATEGFTVYNLQGILVKRCASAAELSDLPAGLYIINGKKQLLRR